MHKRDLFCKEEDGKLHVYQRKYSQDVYVFSLTDNWKRNGCPADWSTLVVINRLKAHDMASDGGHQFFDEIMASYERRAKSKERDMDNTIESFLYEFRPQFARATNDINTSSLAKIDKRRIRDGSIK